MKIYIAASRADRARAARFALKLRAMGCEPALDWWTSAPDTDRFLTDEQRRHVADLTNSAITACDALAWLVPDMERISYGSCVEYGMAVAQCICTIACGPAINDTIMTEHANHKCTTDERALEWIRAELLQEKSGDAA